jgi:hypothetical protein
LRGVRFTAGVQFDFTAGAITNLAAGARLLLVRDTNAFALRYGSGLPVAGQFTGKLDNGGERLRFEDRDGEKILDFSYDNRWFPITDGHGYSLAIVDDTLLWSLWGEKTNWFASTPTAGAPNLPPVPGADGLLVRQGQQVSVPDSTLLANDVDPGGQPLVLAAVNASSHFGATVTRSAGQVNYQPAPNFIGSDWFTYTVAANGGRSAEGRVEVFVYSDALPAASQLSIVALTTGYRVRYRGTPARWFELQRSPDLAHWITLLETAIPPHGIVEYLESDRPVNGAYYRARQR